jgi:hypothetical protein
LIFEEPSAEPQIVAGLQWAVSAALGSGKTHLFGLLLEMLKKELVVLTLQECGGNTQEAEKRLGVSLRDVVRSDGKAQPRTDASLPKALERRVRAVALIQTYPDWTVEQYAKKLGCGKDVFYRDELIKRALDLRKDYRGLSHGHKSRDGTVEAYDDFEE